MLLSKLKTYGITDNHYKLYKSYLDNRYQRTLVYDQKGNAITSTWAKVIHGVPQGSILGPLLFLLFINDLPMFMRAKSTPILFADDTSILISHSNLFDFRNKIQLIFTNLNEWFKNNLLSLNFSKTQLVHFTTRNTNQMEIIIDHDNKTIPICNSTKFLGITVDCTLSWKHHIDLVTRKLSTICYLIRNIKPYLSLCTLKMTYHSLFHSIMSHGIIFWGNSPHSSKIFKIQKRAIRTMMGCGYRESCRKLFMELKILPLTSQYIFSLLVFVVNNRNYFTPNSAIYDSNTRHKNDLHLPQVTLTMYQRGVYYSGIKVFNSNPRVLKDISNKPDKFKIALRKFLLTHSFYSLDEFFDKQ